MRLGEIFFFLFSFSLVRYVCYARRGCVYWFWRRFLWGVCAREMRFWVNNVGDLMAIGKFFVRRCLLVLNEGTVNSWLVKWGGCAVFNAEKLNIDC